MAHDLFFCYRVQRRYCPNWEIINSFIGSKLDGDSHFFSAFEDDLHVTFGVDEALKKFDDNVNSAFCSCLTTNVPYAFAYPSYTPWPHYSPYNYFARPYHYYRGSMVGELTPLAGQHIFLSLIHI